VALAATPMLTPAEKFDAQVRRYAFRLLLETREPVTSEELSRSLATDPERVSPAVKRLREAGRVRTDESGRLVGSAGLSVVPDRHLVEIDSRRFWTWCAYDILGIVGALKADARALTKSPATGKQLELRFRRGQPDDDGLVLFRPDAAFAACCANVYEDWCPNSNLFEDAAAGEAWQREHGVSGTVLPLIEAAEEARKEWVPLVEGRSVPIQ
jgi:DNA-binding transcriptional ArsR family regulator